MKKTLREMSKSIGKMMKTDKAKAEEMKKEVTAMKAKMEENESELTRHIVHSRARSIRSKFAGTQSTFACGVWVYC